MDRPTNRMRGTAANIVIICIILPLLTVAATISSDICSTTDSPTQTIDEEPPYIYVPGVPVILITIPAYDERDGDWKCQTLRRQGGLYTKASLYSIKRIRELTGINFGILILGECHSAVPINRMVYSVMSGDRVIKGQHANGSVVDLNPSTIVAGVSGHSAVTVGLQQVLNFLKIVGLTYSSTTSTLDDKEKYPYFLRTVPSDVKQANAIIDILNTIKVTAFQLIYTPDAYGSEGAKLVRTFASDNGLCITNDLEMKEEPGARDPIQILQKVLENEKSTGAKAVVYFGREYVSKRLVKSLLNDTSLTKDWIKKGMIFVGSDAWVSPSKGKEENDWKQVLRGSLAVRQETKFKIYSSDGEDNENTFSSYLQEENFVRNPYNVFLDTMLAPYCRGESLIHPPNVTLYDMVDTSYIDPFLLYLVETIFIVGYSFQNLAKENECVKAVSQAESFNCTHFITDFYEKLQSVTIPGNSYTTNGETISPFDSNGRNGNLGYLVTQVRLGEGQYVYSKAVFYVTSLGDIQPRSTTAFYIQVDNGLVQRPIDSSCGDTCPKRCSTNSTSERLITTRLIEKENPFVLAILGLVCLLVVERIFLRVGRQCERRHPPLPGVNDLPAINPLESSFIMNKNCDGGNYNNV